MEILPYQRAREFIPRDFDLFAGLDVDKSSISVNILSHERTIKSMRIPNDANNLIGYVRKNFKDQKVAFAYETGPTGWGLYDQLKRHGYVCLVAASSMIPTAPGARVKTNRIDSKKIAESLRGGQLRSIHVPSPVFRDLRHFVHLRDTAIRQATATKNRIKALFLFEGISFPQSPLGSQWSLKVFAELKIISCSPAIRFKLDQLMESLKFAQKQAMATMKEIRRFSTQTPELKRYIGFLTTIPGIGWITASHLLARIGNPKEIQNVRQLGCFLGLTQREDSTGDSINRGSITRYGDGRLRNKLIQAAWAAIRTDPELKEFYHRIYQRHPKEKAARIAIIAVARKMTTRIYAVLHQERNYEVRHHHTIFSDSITQEETIRPRERLDPTQNQKNLDSSVGSLFRQRSRGIFPQANYGQLAQPILKRPGNAPEGTHLKRV